MQFSSILEKLTRVTASQKPIPEVDGLRFIAICTVVLFHLRTHVLRVFHIDSNHLQGDLLFDSLSNGGLGVNLFFTISGFILALPFARYRFGHDKPVRLTAYYVRRVTRLEPPYIIIMSFFFALQIFALKATFNDLLPHYLSSLAYLHFFIYGAWSSINPVAWSLETEVQFYLVAPFIAFVFAIRNSLWRTLFLVVFITLYAVAAIFFFESLISLHLYKSIVFYLPYFILGFLLASVYLTHGDRITKSFYWDIIGALALFVMYRYYQFQVWYWDIILLCCITCVFAGVFYGRALNRIFTFKSITVIGGMCYSIYLIHYVFIYAAMLPLAPILPESGGFYLLFFSACATVLPLLLVISAVVFYFLEKPFMYSKWYLNLREALR